MLPPPLANILSDIRRCFDEKLYYPALTVALTLPEICASCLLPPTTFVKQDDYTRFLTDYVKNDDLGVDPLTCYRLRGGVVHRANASGHPYISRDGEAVENVIFTLPETGFFLHGPSLSVGGHLAITITLEQFLDVMEACVRRWYDEHRENDAVNERIWSMLALRPNGIPGFVDGAPVVASGPEHPELISPIKFPGPADKVI